MSLSDGHGHGANGAQAEVVDRHSAHADHPELLAVAVGDANSVHEVVGVELGAREELEGKLRAAGDVLLAKPELVLVAGATVEALVHSLAHQDLDEAQEGHLRIGLHELTHGVGEEVAVLGGETDELGAVRRGVDSDEVHESGGGEDRGGVRRGHRLSLFCSSGCWLDSVTITSVHEKTLL